MLSLSLSIVALLFAAFALLVSVGVPLRQRYYVTSRPHGGLQPGSDVPYHALKKVYGPNEVALVRNGQAIVTFVSRKCEPCQDLLRNLNGGHPIPQDIPLLMIETAIVDGESLQQAARFTALWSRDSTGEVQRAFMTSATPHSFLIRDGKIASQVPGPDLSSMFEPLSSSVRSAEPAPAS